MNECLEVREANGGAELPSAPSSERCPPASRMALRCKLSNCRRFVGRPYEQLAESA
jgi:hypothetical protein